MKEWRYSVAAAGGLPRASKHALFTIARSQIGSEQLTLTVWLSCPGAIVISRRTSR